MQIRDSSSNGCRFGKREQTEARGRSDVMVDGGYAIRPRTEERLRWMREGGHESSLSVCGCVCNRRQGWSRE